MRSSDQEIAPHTHQRGSSLPKLARRLTPYRGDGGGALAGAEAMLEGVAAVGRACFRWYTVTPPALLLGANQSPEAANFAECRIAGVTVYKRAAGGTAVLADSGLLGLDIALPADHWLVSGDVTLTYRWLGEAWARGLNALGLPVEMVTLEQARAGARVEDEDARVARLACFGALSPYEVTLDARKVVGLAQVRRRGGVLLQSAVLLHWNPTTLASLLTAGADDRALLVTSLRRRAGGLNDDRSVHLMPARIVTAVETALRLPGLLLEDDAWTTDELAVCRRLKRTRYAPVEQSVG